MSIIWTILIGFVVGLLAKMLTPGRDPSGFFVTAAIGVAGSLLATFGGQALGLYNAGEPAGFIGSLVGAIILLVIYHLVRRNSATVR
ncbi:MAG: GlsB/YeaQ/YmgE family stress response membrane protein [Pseudomonadota bacterium]|nr:GlsB/YeaQ/YmgE family stress response membrane protein [Pseudomonadota bacterium]